MLVSILLSPTSLLRRLAAMGGVVCCATILSGQTETPAEAAFVLPERIFPILVPILETASRQAPQTLRAAVEQQMAEEMILVARSRLLPNVGGGGTYSIAQEQRLDRPDISAAEKLTYQFGITQPLYHWGALRAGQEVGKIAARIAERNYAEACRLLLIEVRTLYLRMVVQKAEVGRTTEMLRLARDDLATAQARADTGALAPGEIFTVRLRLQEAELAMEKAVEDLRFAKASLERLAGIAPLADGDIPALIPAVPFDKSVTDALLHHFIHGRGVENDFRATALKLQWEQEKLNYRITDMTLRPKLNLVSGVNQDEVSYTGSPSDRAQIRSFYAGINVTWTVFDGYATKGYRRASLLKLRQLEADRDARLREQVERARNLAKLLEFASRQTALSEGRLSQLDGLVAYQEQEVAQGNLARREAENVRLSRDELLIRTMALRIEYLSRLTEFLSVIGRDPTLEKILSSRP